MASLCSWGEREGREREKERQRELVSWPLHVFEVYYLILLWWKQLHVHPWRCSPTPSLPPSLPPSICWLYIFTLHWWEQWSLLLVSCFAGRALPHTCIACRIIIIYMLAVCSSLVGIIALMQCLQFCLHTTHTLTHVPTHTHTLTTVHPYN